MRAVLDPNVIVAAAPSPGGSPARILRLWLEGAYELVCSPRLLDELTRVFAYPKLRRHLSEEDIEALIELLRGGSFIAEDPESPPDVRSSDPNDNYLIALASGTRSVLVSGDRDLLELSPRLPVYPPAAFLSLIETSS